MMGIEEIHGFRYMGRIYPTREAAEHAQHLDALKEGIETANGVLAECLAELLSINRQDDGDRMRLAKGVCDDLFPPRPDRCEAADEFMNALNTAYDEYLAFLAARNSKKDPQP